MKVHTPSRAGHAIQGGRAPVQRTRLVSLLLPALVLAGCAAAGPMQENAVLAHGAGCRAELVMHDLLGRYPGVQVRREGSGLRVRVRDAMQEPLYVLDGQPLAESPWGVSPAVNPCDIKEIRVLSDPADLTFYGLRGANGVILITTRRQ